MNSSIVAWGAAKNGYPDLIANSCCIDSNNIAMCRKVEIFVNKLWVYDLNLNLHWH